MKIHHQLFNNQSIELTEAATRGVLEEKMFLEILQKSTGKQLCQSPFFKKVAGLRSAILLKKRLWYSFKNTFFTEHLWATNSELSSSSEIDNIIQEGEVIFTKIPTVGLPEVSRLIDSAISKRQADQRKHSFLEKKNTT